MPAKSVVEKSASIPWLKYSLYVAYKAMEGTFEITDNDRKKEILAECGGDKDACKARKAEYVKSVPELRMAIGAARQSFTSQDGGYDLVSNEVDDTSKDLIALRADFRSAPTAVDTFAKLFGRYDKTVNKFVGGKFPSFDSVTVLSGSVGGRNAKLELKGFAGKHWKQAAKDKNLGEEYVVRFSASPTTIVVGKGSKSRTIHPLQADAAASTPEEVKAADAVRDAVLVERDAYQAQLRDFLGQPAPVTADEVAKDFDSKVEKKVEDDSTPF